jgi:hypothetical protein
MDFAYFETLFLQVSAAQGVKYAVDSFFGQLEA